MCFRVNELLEFDDVTNQGWDYGWLEFLEFSGVICRQRSVGLLGSVHSTA